MLKNGSAKGMECHGLDLILNRLKEEDFTVKSFCHDDDTSLC